MPHKTLQEIRQFLDEVMPVIRAGNIQDAETFRKYLEANGYYNIRQMPDGTWTALVDMMFTTALCVRLDAYGYDKRYCYADPNQAAIEIEKLENGDQEPEGWTRRLPE
jgi:tRNA-dihydrouridine synthase